MSRFTSALLTVLLLVSSANAAKPIKLFNGKNLKGWTHFLVKPKVKMTDVWSVKDGILICKGKPGGYLATKKKYESFKLVVEWRWPKTPSNSGVLMRITGKPMMLPNCMEAQLKAGSAGDMYGFQNFKVNGDKKRFFENAKALGHLRGVRKIQGAEKKAGKWNRYDITVNGPKVLLIVNGKKVNEAFGCDVRAGQIGLQSEGGEIHFRKVELTPIKK